MPMIFRPARGLVAILALALVLTACARTSPEAQPTAFVFPDNSEKSLPGGMLPQRNARQAQPTPAPSLTPTPMPTATEVGLDAACVVGRWQVNDPGKAMGELYAHSESTLALERVEGQTLYEFTPEGGMQITFDRLSATFGGSLDNRQVSVQQSLNGAATARYAVDSPGHALALTDFGGDGIQFALSINEQVLAQGSMPAWRALTTGLSSSETSNAEQPPAAQPTAARVAAQCSGDVMTVQAVDPLPGPQVQLSRVP